MVLVANFLYSNQHPVSPFYSCENKLIKFKDLQNSNFTLIRCNLSKYVTCKHA